MECYNLTSPHLIHRQTSANCILIKDDTGRAKPSAYNLPPESHAYGVGSVPDGESAAKCLSWAPHIPSSGPRSCTQDFGKMNKMAVRHGIATPVGLAEYRRNNSYPLVEKTGPGNPQFGPKPMVIPSDVFPHFYYGRKCRPSTPAAMVISHGYGKEADEAREVEYAQIYAAKAQRTAPIKVQLTKSDKMRITNTRGRGKMSLMEPDEPPKLWKMTKFDKVQSHMAREGMTSRLASLPNLAQTR
eukprot:gnl/TRDRNA2_/TRDRNA2_187321_c0_seq1.p1 gnl/TRDRNA2_/TRDRNA2_187321_c0~~gnl/TRDRNA2_/TRDRNA2_187321_c0_seq1.p1  ORF type:complete len:243 (-),score=20.22 gnl/TRDRNA2_/TRDRNA2_187321_c0_seq1:155-883(-)